MYFWNGFGAGFITGLFCFLVHVYPVDETEITNEQSLARQTGACFGLIAGLASFATLIVGGIKAAILQIGDQGE